MIWRELMANTPDTRAQKRFKLAQAEVLLAQNRFAETLEVLEEIFAAAPDALTLHALGLVARAAGNLDDARAWFRKEQSFLPLFDAMARADNAWELAQLDLQQDRLVSAIAWLRTCLLQARFAADTSREARVRRLLGDLSLRRGRLDLAQDHYEAARAACLKAGDERGLRALNTVLAGLPQELAGA